MTAMFQTLKGMRDWLPEEAGRWAEARETLRRVFARYGYGEIVTPIMEMTELFARGLGEGSDIVHKEMYTFTDRGDRSVTLRPEGTAPVVRAAINAGLLHGGKMVKLCYFGPMFRYERPQKGRMREFYQYGVEALGGKSLLLDAEVIAMAMVALRECGVEGASLLLNSVGCPESECRPAYVEKLKTFAAPLAASGKLCGECAARLERNALRVLDCKNEGCRAALEKAPRITDCLCADCAGHFDEVQKGLKACGVAFALEPHLVRGLDYYVRTAFEVTHGSLGAQNALLGGGRYDGLCKELGGPDVPGIGFAGGVERLLLAMPEKGGAAGLDVYIAVLGDFAADALALAERLRNAGLNVEMNFDAKKKLGAQIGEASKLKARWAVILGEDERKSGMPTVKNLGSGEQTSMREEDFLKKALEKRS
jgi:histidyl-tRNA synthetase